MGTGRSGLPKGVRDTTKKVQGFKITSKNAKDYGITLIRRKSNKYSKSVDAIIDKSIDDALETINKAGVLLGLDPNNLPKVDINYGKYSATAYGDAKINIDKTDLDATINLYSDMFWRKNFDTAAHEYTHAIESWIIRQNLESFHDRAVAWADDTYSEAICRNALVSIGKQSSDVIKLDKAAWADAAGTVKLNQYDTYATKSTAETLTRSVQVVLRQGDVAPDYAKAVVNALKEEIQRTYKLSNKK